MQKIKTDQLNLSVVDKDKQYLIELSEQEITDAEKEILRLQLSEKTDKLVIYFNKIKEKEPFNKEDLKQLLKSLEKVNMQYVIFYKLKQFLQFFVNKY